MIQLMSSNAFHCFFSLSFSAPTVSKNLHTWPKKKLRDIFKSRMCSV